MARLVTSGFELNSKTSAIEFDNSSVPGSITLVTSPTKSGTYAASIATSSQASFAIYNAFSTNQNTTGYAKIWIYVSVAPAVTTNILQLRNVSNGAKASIALTSGLQLQLVNSTSVQVGSSSSALSLSTWYCIEVSCDSSVSNGTITGRLDGNTFATGAGNAATGWGRGAFGIITSTTATIVFDGFAINDNQGSSQTSFPGMSQIVRATPTAAGDSNGFATNVGGTAGAANNYTRVSEITPDSATTYNASNTLNAADMFTVSPTIPSGAVINCVVVGGQFANITTADATTAFKWQVEKTSGGTISQSAAIIPNSTSWLVNQVPSTNPGASFYTHVLYNDPDGNPWTTTTAASMQIGYKLTAAGTNSIGVSDVWALVDYSAAPSISVSDTVTGTESTTVSMSRLLSTSESVTLTENVNLNVAAAVSVSDTATLSESIGLLATKFISVSDTITATESTSATASAVLISVQDNVTTSESISGESSFEALRVMVMPGIQQINGVKIV